MFFSLRSRKGGKRKVVPLMHDYWSFTSLLPLSILYEIIKGFHTILYTPFFYDDELGGFRFLSPFGIDETRNKLEK